MSTLHILFEQLENAGYIKDDAVNLDRVCKVTLAEIIDLGTESAELTSVEQVSRNQMAFAHSASLSLGGWRYPCAKLKCRIQHINELSQFAALYSDAVYINNFLTDHTLLSELQSKEDLEWAQGILANDLEILLQLRPLIEAGRAIIVSSPVRPDKFGANIDRVKELDPQMINGFNAAGDYLWKRFTSDAKVTIEKRGSQYVALILAPEDLLEHGAHYLEFHEMPEALHKLPEIRRQLAHDHAVPLSKRQAEKLGIFEREISIILENVLFELTISQSFGTSFLTERPVHVKILQSLTESSRQEQRNAVIKRHLTTLVPFLEGLETSELLKLREEEADSFVLFRQALNRAVDEATNENTELTERQAREIYGDLLEPSLARLELKLQTAQNSLVKAARRKTSAWVGAITFGMLSGILPDSLKAVAAAMGLTKVLADLGETTLQTHIDENVIRNEDMYFLWKVRQKTRSR